MTYHYFVFSIEHVSRRLLLIGQFSMFLHFRILVTRAHFVVWLLVGCFAIATSADGSSKGERSSNSSGPLAEIIRQVRQNESLYSNIEVRWKFIYQIPDQASEAEKLITASRSTLHYVNTGERFLLRENGLRLRDSQQVSRDYVSAFDGETTRVVDNARRASIFEGRVLPAQHFDPYMILRKMGSSSTKYPLSTYLSGHDAARKHPDGDREIGAYEVTYEGEEQFTGLKCKKVRVWGVKRNNNRWHHVWEFWIAEARNHLPVRLLCFDLSKSAEIPTFEGALEDLKEIAPGVWFPFSAKAESFNKQIVGDERRQVLQWRSEVAVEKVVLSPRYPESFFSIEIPDGVEVTEHIGANGISIKYVQGESPVDQGLTELQELNQQLNRGKKKTAHQSGDTSTRTWWTPRRILLLAVVVISLGVSWVWQRYRKHPTA